jgi:hypothetical protein
MQSTAAPADQELHSYFSTMQYANIKISTNGEGGGGDPTMVLSKPGSAKSSTMKSQSRIRTKFQVKSTTWAKI